MCKIQLIVAIRCRSRKRMMILHDNYYIIIIEFIAKHFLLSDVNYNLDQITYST